MSSSQSSQNADSDQTGPEKYQNVREYAEVLQQWLWQYRFLSSMQQFSMQLPYQMSCLQQISRPRTSTGYPFGSVLTGPAAGLTVPAPPQGGLNQGQGVPLQGPAVNTGNNLGRQDKTNAYVFDTKIGVHYKIPLLWKRVAAEVLDFILLFYVKIMVTVAVLRQMGYLEENNIQELELHLPLLFTDFTEITDMDFEKAFSITSELLALEIVNRICITLVETLCIRHGYAGSVGGSTPGKRILGLKVVACDEIHDAGYRRIHVINPRNAGFVNALVRSVIKNFSMAFFFPACVTVFFFRFNRAAYDVMAHTIVVEMDELRIQEG